jgi:hypothetical protein
MLDTVDNFLSNAILMDAEEINEWCNPKRYIDGAAIDFNIQDGTNCQRILIYNIVMEKIKERMEYKKKPTTKRKYCVVLRYCKRSITIMLFFVNSVYTSQIDSYWS